MSKSNFLEGELIDLIFNGNAIANLADNAATSPYTQFYLSLHTGDPGEAGNQTTNEATYGSYARQAVARAAGGFTVSGNSATLTSAVSFPEATSGSETITHFAVGTDASGVGNLLYSGTVSPNIAVSTGVTPQLDTGTSISED